MTPANQLDFGLTQTGSRTARIAAMDAGETKRAERRDATTRGFATAARAARRPMETAAARRGIAEARLISAWVDIVGQSLAAVCRPIKIRHRRLGADSETRQAGVLVLAVSGASATEVEFFTPQIIERVNAAYGYGAISEIAITQAHAPLPPLETRETPKQARLEDLTSDARTRLEAMTRPVEDDALRDALTRLGANVMSKTEKSGAKGSKRSR